MTEERPDREVRPVAPGVAGIRLGTAFGIPIDVHPTWVIVFGLVSWTLATGYFPERDPGLSPAGAWLRAVTAALLFFASVLLHELGHSVVALRLGIPIQSITLFVFGGVSRMGREPEDGRAELKVAVAGPAVSILLAGIFFVAAQPPVLGDAAREIARYLAGINLAVALFNLVPAFPLDGGRVLRGLLWPSTGKLRATRAASLVGAGFGGVLILLGAAGLVAGRPLVGFWYLLLGWFLKDAAAGAYRQAQIDETLGGLTVADAMAREVEAIASHISVTEAAQEAALRHGHAFFPVTRGGTLVGVLRLDDLVRVPFDERDSTSVQAVMRPLQPALTTSPEEPLVPTLARLMATPGGELLVVAGGHLMGLLSGRDIARLVKVRSKLA